jgi:hypothetical protein
LFRRVRCYTTGKGDTKLTRGDKQAFENDNGEIYSHYCIAVGVFFMNMGNEGLFSVFLPGISFVMIDR